MRLTIDDIREVRRLLFSIRIQWYSIGIELKLNIGELDTIRAMYGDPGECLTEMLKVWLKSDHPPTWKALGEALKAEPIGEEELAKKAYSMSDDQLLLTHTRIPTITDSTHEGQVATPQSHASPQLHEVSVGLRHQNDSSIVLSGNTEVVTFSSEDRRGSSNNEITLNLKLVIEIVPPASTVTSNTRPEANLQATAASPTAIIQSEVPHPEEHNATINVTVPASVAGTTSTLTVSHSRLSEGLPWISQKLAPYSYRWIRIATELGFTLDEINNIEATPLLIDGAPYSYLRVMLASWQHWAPGDARGSKDYATIETLRKALRNVGLESVAQDI